MLDAFKNSRLSVKIALLGCSSVLLTTLLLLAVVTWQTAQYNNLAQNEVDKLIESDLNHITTGVYNLIKAEFETYRANDGRANPEMVSLRVRHAILGITIGKTGYVYLLDTNGRYVISQHGGRDGETILGTRDIDGNYVIKDIIRKATAVKPGELSTVRYRWQNPGEPAPRWKIARVTHFAPFNWVVGASVYEDELEAYRNVLTKGRLRMMDIMIISGSLITLLFGIFGIAVARSIAHPVLKLKGAVESVIDGELDQVIEVRNRDEIGSLAQSFNNMTASLRNSVTELRETLDDLRESEAQLKLAEEISHLGSWTFDLVNNRLSWSDETFRIFGHAPQEFQPTYDIFLQAIHPDDRQMVDSAFSESLHGQGNQYDIVHRIIIKSTGEIRTVREKCMHSRDAAGRIARSNGMVLDITDRKRTEEALEKRILALTRPIESPGSIDFEELFNLDDIQRLQDEFAEATGVASIITHPDGTPITRPSNFCRLCSDIIRNTEKGLANCYKSDALLGRYSPKGPMIQTCMSGGLWDAGAGISVGGSHIANWLIGQVRDETQTEAKMRDYAKEIGADEDSLIEAFREVPAMSRGQFDRVARVLFTLANQLSTAAYQNVQQARFISERREMEKELQLLNAELEKRVALRTAELERLNRELESFCYSISHEIRAPIARLTGFSRAISESVADADIDTLKHLAERTEIASERLRSVIDALLTKNRLSRARLSLEHVDMSALCREIVIELRETAGERVINAVILPGVTGYADREMIWLCLKHLLANAVKYTSRKPKAVIEFGRSGDAGSEIYFIRDNGDGFDMEFADKLFKPFSRLHNEEEFEGSGFGLALVHEVIERHNGRIWAQSSPGKGATFFFTLGTQSPG